MKKIILIQSRLSSSRFPKKMISKITKNITLVEYVYNRSKVSKEADNVVIITSNENSDDELYNLCLQKNIPIFRGDLNNVLSRYIKAGEYYNSSTICRVCGDSPFVDVNLIDKMFINMKSEELEYITIKNCLNGFVSEIIDLKTLKNISKITNKQDDLEHVTKYIVDNITKFKHKMIDSNLRPNDLKNITLTVDYESDLNLTKKVISYLNGFDFTSNNIIDILREIK